MATNNHAAEIAAYITSLDSLYRAGNATEHSYRPALKTLLEALTASADGIAITNEPKHIACGAPDYILTKNGIPLGYIEAKDIPVGLDNKANKEQIERYKKALGNLILTDYLSFRLFSESEVLVTVSIASLDKDGGISPDKKQFPAFLELINQFVNYFGKTIYNSDDLAKIMVGKAKLLSEIIKKTLKETSDNNSLAGQYEGFKKVLMHDLSESDFADIYAQTLSYGLFAARLNQKTDGQFTRFAAAQLIPQSNPFLRKFFNFIAGIELDSRIVWIVDALSDVFNYAAIEYLLKEFGKANQDPYIHFYETFLTIYNSEQRKMRGVYYTPVSVVKFIVEAVDDILKNNFSLPQGLADYSKVTRTKEIKDVSGKIEKTESIELHKVQILDPATGTGTFLAEVIEKIYSYFTSNKGAWNDYCEKHLIPRLHGFEILMASYAMAHFKLDMVLKETGFSLANVINKRFHIYLTNTLEEAPEKVPELFMARWLAEEAEEAGRVKRDAPVMVVMGNPPYNVSTQNKNEWIDGLIAIYKKDLNEKNIQPLSDDYIKFIRYGQYLIEKNGFGILAYISNNSFIDGIIHRTMRKTLLETFDKIYILDLHGNARKKENAPDGSADENVFDIMQGVCINIFVKTGVEAKSDFAQVYHSELFGRRNFKYQFLYENKLSTINWKKLNPEAPYFFFVPKDFYNKDEYEKGFSIQELFSVCSNGIKTQRDDASIKFTKEECNKIKNDFLNLSTEELKQKYGFEDVRDWKVNNAKKDLKTNAVIAEKIQYRPFDFRYMLYTGKIKGIMGYPRYDVMKHFIGHDNVGLVNSRQFGGHKHFISYVTNGIIEISSQPYAPYTVFPLYLYEDGKRTPNLNLDIVKKISLATGLLYPVELAPDDYKGFYTIDGTPKENRASIRAYLKKEVQKRTFKILGKEEPVMFGSRSITNLVAFGMSNQVNMKLFRHFWTLLEFSLPIGDEKKPREKDDVYQKYLYAKSLFMFENECYAAYFVFGYAHNKWEFVSITIRNEKISTSRKLHEPNAVQEAEIDLSIFNTQYAAIPKNCQEGIVKNREVFSPLDILDYIYAVLYSPAYREKYRGFLKIDFPRVPYPTSAAQFQKLAAIGAVLRDLHLLKNVYAPPDIATFPIIGNCQVEKLEYKDSKVWINKHQYFENVPASAWEFYIGGYQPAQKWLKDRKDRSLSFDDIEHYRKIIFALAKTIEIQLQIDGV